MKKDQGFTLIELLGVIIILAVVALIIIPVVTGYIESSKKKAFINSVYHSMQSIDEDLASQDFAKFPEEGISAKDGLVNIERNPFIGGKYILKNKKMYADRVTDGRYCAVGEKESLKVVLGDCYLLDETAPIVDSVVAGMVTSNSIQVVVNAKDEESDIVSYEYSKDNGKTYTSKQTSNRYTFTNLTHDTSFNIVVRVTNENKLTSSKSVTLKTLLINTPTFTSSPGLGSWSKSKVVTVTYPGTKQSNFVYEYRKDNGTWTEVSGTSQNVTFTANGTIEARVRDGYNVVNAATLTLTTIDTSAPGVPTSVIRYDSSSGTVRGNSSSWTNRTLWWGNFSVTDTGGSGINHYEYSQNCTGSKSGNLSSSHTYASNTNYTFCIRAVDNAGNIGPWSSAYYFRVDKSAPTCSSSGSNGAWTNKDITLSGACTDTGGSGCKSNVSRSFTSNTNGSYSPGTIYDNAGNSVTCPSLSVKIDKTPPAVPTIDRRVSTSKTMSTSKNTAFNNRYIYCATSGNKHFGFMKYTSSDTGGSGIAGIYTKVWYGPNAAAGCGNQSESAVGFTKRANGYISSIICNSGGLVYTKAYACDNAGNCSATTSSQALSWNVGTIKGYINNSGTC